ncbi:hypothetical protein GCM10010412_038710 [Nonomuraea recticatena]|uniref:Uncharacterized protein n=1 Tax=Nonomuraea recticatena TaxID=46178 RepID=A0ABP6EF04_9ACTN
MEEVWHTRTNRTALAVAPDPRRVLIVRHPEDRDQALVPLVPYGSSDHPSPEALARTTEGIRTERRQPISGSQSSPQRSARRSTRRRPALESRAGAVITHPGTQKAPTIT